MTAAPPRPAMSKARRLRLFTRDGGFCDICKRKVLAGEAYELDHIIPWALGFDDSDENLRLVHKTCHRTDKTGGDVARIAKAKRQGRETGQQARRAVKGGSIPSRPFPKTKTTWPKRPFKGRES